jgi:hypothetical protein
MPLEQLEDYIAAGVEQLKVAIDLFVGDISYISALVLAVAAEEQFKCAIYSRARKKDGGGQEDGEEALRSIFEISKHLDPSVHTMTYDYFRKTELRERRAAVHGPDSHGAQDKQQAMRPLRHAAEAAIQRALLNARELGLARSEANEQFEHWYMWNVAPQ